MEASNLIFPDRGNGHLVQRYKRSAMENFKEMTEGG